MRSIGGLFLSHQLRSKEGDDPRKVIRQYGIVWGPAIRDAEDVTRKKRNVSFLVKYDEEPNPRYGLLDAKGRKERKDRPLCVKCYARGTKTVSAVLSAIEKGDTVLCVGRVKSHLQKTKKRGEMWFHDMNVEIIIPSTLIQWLFRACFSHGINELLDAEDNEAPDVWEEW